MIKVTKPYLMKATKEEKNKESRGRKGWNMMKKCSVQGGQSLFPKICFLPIPKPTLQAYESPYVKSTESSEDNGNRK